MAAMNFPSLFLLVLANLWLVSASSEIQLSDNLSPVFIYESIGKALIEKNTHMSGFIHGELGNGRLFNDSRDLGLSALTPCVGVELTWFPSHLESIRFIYTADDAYDRSVYHGVDTGAAREKFILENGEKIIKVKTYTGTSKQALNDEKSVFIVGIQFTTTKGRVSRLFGSSKGREQSELFDTFALGYAVGTSGKVLNQLQIVWQNQETVKVNENNTFVAYCYNAPESKSLKLVIIKATYQSKDDPALTVADVTDKARKRCGDKNSCKFTVNDANLQKHMCFDCSKELEITYACSYHRKIYGPLITNRKYIGNDISKDNQEYISDVKNLDDCGRHCLGQSDCGGVQLDRDHRCYLKSKMAEYENEDGWMAMAVVH